MLAIRLGKLLKEQEEQIKSRDESLEKAREEIKWLREMLKEQEAKNYEERVNKYHLSCDHCGADWWSKDPFPKKCPFCEVERSI